MAAAKKIAGCVPLAEHDPELAALIKREEDRQLGGLELIASENFTTQAVLEAYGSVLTNKYSEGLPGRRYYGGNEVVDEVESLCQSRALTAFGLSPDEWGVNVQPYSGSVANFAAFNAVLEPHDRVMGLSLTSGGHLSHGFYRGHARVNVSSKYFESLPYELDAATGLVDYDGLAALALRYSPKLIVAGGSAYPRDWDYARMREIADSVGALLLTDMAHYSGLVAGKVVASPFEHSDIVTTTTHKSLGGPRAALIFSKAALCDKVNTSVFPGVQGGPHNHAIAAVATQLLAASSDAFAAYARQVVDNARHLASKLQALGHTMASGGTDTHLFLWDLRPKGITGSKFEALCDIAHITVNKNTLMGDKSAFNPGGVRIGTPALTSRGFVEADFDKVAEFLHRAFELTVAVQKTSGKKLVDFKAAAAASPEVEQLGKDVRAFATQFPLPGVTKC